jgi:RNA-directed DNA polymerase
MSKIKPKSKEGWNMIKWATIEVYVRKLQKRIYSATKSGDYILVRSLQNILVNSYQAKLLATRRVTQDNKGKKNSRGRWHKSTNPYETPSNGRISKYSYERQTSKKGLDSQTRKNGKTPPRHPYYVR